MTPAMPSTEFSPYFLVFGQEMLTPIDTVMVSPKKLPKTYEHHLKQSPTTPPLWEFTCDKTKWRWTKEEQRAFDEVKRRLTKAPTMAYHRLDADTRIVTDASPVGLGAILQPKQEDEQYKPVYYASRKLRDAETSYSQFERESLLSREVGMREMSSLFIRQRV